MPYTPTVQNPIVRQVFSAATLNGNFYIHTGLTVYNYPTSVVAAENPIVWSLSSNTISASQSWYSGYIEVISTGLTANTSFILSAATPGAFPTFQFTAAAEPKVNEFYCNITSPSRTVSQIAESLAEAMNANFAFRQRFVVTYHLGFVYIEALQPGSHWNVDYALINGSGSWLNYSDLTVATDYYDSQNYVDFGVYADLYINSEGDLGSNLDRTHSERIAQFENSYNANNIYTFDSSGTIKNYISTPTPTLSATTMESMREALINCYFVFGSKYDEFNNGYRRQFLKGQTNNIWALNSSLPFNEVNNLSAYTITNNVTAATMSYLTNSPNPKQVFNESHEYLSFLYSNSEGAQLPSLAFWVMVDINYVDGSSDTDEFEINFTSINTTGGSLYCTCISPTQFFSSGNTHNGQLVDSYTVRLIQSTGVGSYWVRGEDKIYKYVDDCLLEGATEFLWLNPLGGWDTFIFNGEKEEDIDRKITTFQIPVSFQGDYYSNSTIDNIDVNKKIKARSGYIDKTHLDWLFEMFKSTDTYIIQNGEKKRIVITGGDWKPISNNNLFNVTVEYIPSAEENFIKN